MASAQNDTALDPDAIVTSATEGPVTATLDQTAPWYSTDATFAATVNVSSTRPKTYVEVRMRIRRPSGRIIYQRTAASTEPTTNAVFNFTRDLGPIDLREGRYRLEVRVLATGEDPIELRDRVLLVKAGGTPVPLVIVPRIGHTPMTDPEGRFVIDPATEVRSRDQAAGLAELLARDPRLKLTWEITPLMIDEWRRVADGYTLLGPEGARQVPATSQTSRQYAAALRELGVAVRDQRSELLSVPWAQPDLVGLASIGAMDDLGRQYARGLSSMRAGLDATTSAGTAVLGDTWPAASVPQLQARKVRYAIVATASAAATSLAEDGTSIEATTAAPGRHRLGGTRIKALVYESTATAALGTRDGARAVFDALFDARVETGTPEPVVVIAAMGPGSPVTVDDIASLASTVAAAPWVTMNRGAEVASLQTSSTISLPRNPPNGRPAPRGYWTEVAAARRDARAFIEAVGANDPDAKAAVSQTLVSESRMWAGVDGTWSLADRGRAYALAARNLVGSFFDAITVDVSNVTLSSDTGRVPVTIRNTSRKTFRLTVRTAARSADFPSGGSIDARVRPGDNYVTVPVRLGQSLRETVLVSVWADGLQLASSSLVVTASFIDRLVLAGAVALALAVLLWWIIRRVRRAQREPYTEDDRPSEERPDEWDAPEDEQAGRTPDGE